MPARTWATIDAEMDNTIALAVVDCPEHAVTMGSAIRQAGWDQVPWVEGGWPPMTQEITISLTKRQWEFAADRLGGTIPVCASIGDHESEQLCRTALTTIRAGQ